MVDDYYEPTLGDHLRAARRLWPVVAVATVLGALLGLAAGAGSSDSEWTSEAIVSVVDERFVTDSLDLQIADISTPSATAEMDRALADDVAALATERAGESVEATAVADESAGTFTITVTADDPQAAVDGATIYGQAAVELAQSERADVLAQTAAALTRRIEELDAELVVLRAQLEGADPTQTATLQSEIDITVQRRLQFGDRLAALESFQDTTTGGVRQLTLASDAEESGGGLSPLILLIGGALLGALVGFGLVVIINLGDRRIRTRADAELNSRGLPVLGVLARGESLADSPTAQALRRAIGSSVKKLILAPAGSDDVDPALASQATASLTDLGAEVDVSVGSMDSLAFDDQAQGVVLVATAGSTTDDDLACRVTELADMGAHAVGTILTGVDPRDLPRAAAGLDTRRDDDAT